MTTMGLRLLAGIGLLAACSLVNGRELPQVRPESVGMSGERLARIDALMQRAIEAGTIVNGVTLVARHGRVVHHQAHGARVPGGSEPLGTDALFRMASSSKPVIAAAILMLVEEGRVRLNDPVSRFLPEFRNLQVAQPRPGVPVPPPLPPGAPVTGPKPDVDRVAAHREITLRDLLTHTAGLFTGGLGQRLSADLVRAPDDRLEDYIPRLGQAVLDFQPGTRWGYSAAHGFDVLGRVIEVVSGQTLDRFLAERVFAPLDMRDTVFLPDAAQAARLNQVWRRTPAGTWEVNAGAATAFSGPRYFSGSGGLISTARDYARFEQMLLDGGTLDGRRLLAPRSVELMRMNHVGTLYNGFRGDEQGVGFGLAVEVTLDEAVAALRRSAGSAGWNGAFGTISWHDPREGLVAVLMVQQSSAPLRADFANAVLQAVTESAPAR